MKMVPRAQDREGLELRHQDGLTYALPTCTVLGDGCVVERSCEVVEFRHWNNEGNECGPMVREGCETVERIGNVYLFAGTGDSWAAPLVLGVFERDEDAIAAALERAVGRLGG